MKKLYNGKVKRVHPSPSPPPLAALPAAVMALAAALTAEEQEVLAHLLSGAGGGGSGGGCRKRKQNRGPHDPELGCACFECYKSFWARWDASPNRHLIHLIIDAFEESLESQERDRTRAGGRRRAGRRRGQGSPDKESTTQKGDMPDVDDGSYNGGDDDEQVEVGLAGNDDIESKSSVRRLVSFIGERVWSVWN